ncbi:MAG: monovalent cation/H(+) antiporter subunit G [Anaerolineales bacterium]|jgi:multicomponent Na+:H+ antiporter subunit G|nr:monovalent cation/H(+) antiporter subunit G [Anaerolineales bacterium]
MQIPEIILKSTAILLILLGSLYSSLGMLGLVRFPDVYTRLHATGKISAFGAVFLLGAAIAVLPELTIFKGLILILFLLLASPVVAHTISSAAYKSGLPLAQSGRDDLAEHLPRASGKDI